MAVLESSSTVAIVGLSTDPAKASSGVAKILIRAGYDVIPVHPTADVILGRKAYPSLADIPVPIDIVDVFRPAAEAAGIAQQAASVGARTLWLQLGIVSDDAQAVAADAGLVYLEDLCIGETTKRLGNRPAAAAA
ncbi:CoA-binding protein [Microbacterium pumilum]|uniref:CoA-binding protein n=2 Tax=Microbacterium pumilum TaxID=344165 RepID=A0ABN2S4J1_9MICO